MADVFLQKILRSGASAQDAALLASNYHNTFQVQAHADILDCEVPSGQVHVLLEGWACKYQMTPNGGRQIVYIHLPGEVCNLDRLYRSEGVSSVSAMGDCQVATFSVDWLKRVIGEVSSIRDLFWALTVAENVAMTDRIVSLGGRSSRQRVAHFLLDLLVRMEALGQAPFGTLRLPLTQQDIGDVLGLSTVHVNRTLQALRDDGLVSSKGRTYTVRDRSRLQALAEGTGASERSAIEMLASRHVEA